MKSLTIVLLLVSGCHIGRQVKEIKPENHFEMALAIKSDVPDHAYLVIFEGDKMNDTFYVAPNDIRRISTADWADTTRRTQSFLCHLLPTPHDSIVLYEHQGK